MSYLITCTTSDLDKNSCKVKKKKIQVKLLEDLHSQDIQCICALSPKITKFMVKMTKNESEDYILKSCTSSDLDKSNCKVSKRSG